MGMAVGPCQQHQVAAVAARVQVGLQRPRVGQHDLGRAGHHGPGLAGIGLEAKHTVAACRHADHRQRQHQQTGLRRQGIARAVLHGAALPHPQAAIRMARGDAAMAAGQRRERVQPVGEPGGCGTAGRQGPQRTAGPHREQAAGPAGTDLPQRLRGRDAARGPRGMF